jgi:hypothetical protein
MAGIPNDRLFNDSQYAKVREQWCAGMLGIGYEKHVATCRVGVNESSERLDADLFLEAVGKEFPFQLVEVMEPDRKRGAEYKGQVAGTLRGFGFDPEAGRLEGPRWIAARIAEKTNKRYARSSDLNLLVYANFPAHQLAHDAVIEATRPHFGYFASLWVITNLWLGSLQVANELGRIDGWGTIFTAQQYAADVAG